MLKLLERLLDLRVGYNNMWLFLIIVIVVWLCIVTGGFGFMELSKEKRISIIVVFIAVVAVIISVALCIKFYSEMNKYRADADYTYDLYIQGISDTEKEMYQEWIDSLGTDEYSAYRQGYSDGQDSKQFDSKNTESTITNSDNLSAYRQGYLDGQSDGYDEGYDNGWDSGYDEGYNYAIDNK